MKIIRHTFNNEAIVLSGCKIEVHDAQHSLVRFFSPPTYFDTCFKINCTYVELLDFLESEEKILERYFAEHIERC